jgi:hypothetical protein
VLLKYPDGKNEILLKAEAQTKEAGRDDNSGKYPWRGVTRSARKELEPRLSKMLKPIRRLLVGPHRFHLTRIDDCYF